MTDWHRLTSREALEAAMSAPHGLSHAEATRRLALHGPNNLPPPRRRGPVLRFLLQFHNVLIYVLVASAAVTALLAHWTDSGVIAGVVVVNAIVGFIQEGKAERAMEAIRRMLPVEATVLREGKRETIAAEMLVPGDIALLQSGDKVPADMRLLDAKSLRIEEAVLTGESEPAEKNVAPAAADAALGDRACMAYSGTLVVHGQGMGVVTGTGAATEIGRISVLLAEVHALETPLLRQMKTFARWLTVAIVALAAAMFAVGWLIHEFNATDMFLAAVSMAVAAIPEGLPAVVTITLALGVQRMGHRNAIVRRLPAVEALGSVTVICTDKTGTLTTNEMTVQRVAAGRWEFEVSGTGYAPHGGFAVGGLEADLAAYPRLLDLLRAGLLCNDAALQEGEGAWHCAGDPTECALLTLAMKGGLDPGFERQSLPRTDVIPFESAHRFMATLHHDHAGHAFIILKGAPERVLDLCDRQRGDGGDGPLANSYWTGKISGMGEHGLRALALAIKPADARQRELDFPAVEGGGFTLLGLAGIADPPREEAIAAVRECQGAGIRIKMVTGDHAETARFIAARMGIGDGRTLTGHDLDELDDTALRQAVPGVDIYARANPEHKLRLVQALQANHEIVAMTGDGVNDSPALKRADIGVAMGLKGTEAAREAAMVVLADDNFATIAHAVEEGRTVYDNIRKAIVFLMPTNAAEAAIVLLAVLFGMTLPITPAQILWVNMVTASTLALALSFEPPEPGVMQRPPRGAGEPILSGYLVWRIAFVSLLLTGGPLALFLIETESGATLQESRGITINALVAGQMAYLLNCRYLIAPVSAWRDVSGNRHILTTIAILAGLQAVFTFTPLMQHLFGVSSPGLEKWGAVAGFGMLVFGAVEIEKTVIRALRRH